MASVRFTEKRRVTQGVRLSAEGLGLDTQGVNTYHLEVTKANISNGLFSNFFSGRNFQRYAASGPSPKRSAKRRVLPLLHDEFKVVTVHACNSSQFCANL